MRVDPRQTEVRRIVIQVFRGFGASPRNLFDVEEEVMIDEGRYLARTYRVDGLMAMWLVEVGIVQFYDADGEMLATVNLLHERTPERIAA